ncbi:MAG: methyltransferase domain-containing protein [Bacteroidetes bacterium]|nr:MAG: methyltransferase domain-containing protein [Bacteroidota bacterium]
MFFNRSSDKELMDDLNCSGEVLNRTLTEIENINHWLGGDAITINGLNQIINNTAVPNPLSIADLGCGSGGMFKVINNWAKKHQIKVNLTGIDANPNVIKFARDNHKDLNINFLALNILSENFKTHNYDIILCTLLLHHFLSEEIVALIKQLKDQARIAVIVNDLHRHPIAYYSIKWLTGLFSRSEMVKFDAPLSVKRGFTKKELIEILNKAGIQNYSLVWKYAFRWQLIIR